MDENSTSNGHQNGQTRVKFGSGETQDIPIEWAEYMLTDLAAKHQAIFSKLLSMAALGR